MEIALEQLVGQGILGTFLVLVIWYFLKREKELKAEMKDKSFAHAESMKEKDVKIQVLNDQIRNDAIESMSIFKDMHSNLKDLVNELKIRNNG